MDSELFRLRLCLRFVNSKPSIKTIRTYICRYIHTALIDYCTIMTIQILLQLLLESMNFFIFSSHFPLIHSLRRSTIETRSDLSTRWVTVSRGDRFCTRFHLGGQSAIPGFKGCYLLEHLSMFYPQSIQLSTLLLHNEELSNQNFVQ